MLLILASCVFIGERTAFEPDEPGIYHLSTCGGDSIGANQIFDCAIGVPEGLQVETTFTAPYAGTWVFSTQDIDTVLQIFDREDDFELGCGDDELANLGSQVRVYLKEEQTVDVRVTAFEDCGDFRMHVAPEADDACSDLLAPSWERESPGLLPQYGELDLRHETLRDWFDVLVPARHRCYWFSDENTLLSLDIPETEGIELERSRALTAAAVDNAPWPLLIRAEPDGLDASTCPAYQLSTGCIPCEDTDDFEPNDTRPTAASIFPSFQAYELTLGRDDEDWFRISTAPGQSLALSTFSGEVQGMVLTDPNGFVYSDTFGDDGFTLNVDGTVAGDYVLQIAGQDCGFYDLMVEVF